jgi:hypothetical protein
MLGIDGSHELSGWRPMKLVKSLLMMLFCGGLLALLLVSYVLAKINCL